MSTPQVSQPATPASTPNPQVTQKAPEVTQKPDPKIAPAGQTQAAIPAKVTSEQAAVNQGDNAVRKFKLKVDGQDIELPESEVLLRAQKATAAEKRFQEAQQARQQAEAFMNLLRGNFTELLDDPRLGLEEGQKRKMLEDYYKRKYLDPEMLSPEQRKMKEQEAELNRYRQQEEFKKQEAHQQQLKQLEDFHRENYQKIAIEALGGQGLPKTEFTVRRMADLMIKNLQMGLDLKPEHLATLVKEDYVNEIKSLFSATDGDALLGLMGDDIANKLRKADLARLRAGQPQVPKPIVETPKTNVPENPRKYQSFDEMRAERERKVQELQQQWKRPA